GRDGTTGAVANARLTGGTVAAIHRAAAAVGNVGSATAVAAALLAAGVIGCADLAGGAGAAIHRLTARIQDLPADTGVAGIQRLTAESIRLIADESRAAAGIVQPAITRFRSASTIGSTGSFRAWVVGRAAVVPFVAIECEPAGSIGI